MPTQPTWWLPSEAQALSLHRIRLCGKRCCNLRLKKMHVRSLWHGVTLSHYVTKFLKCQELGAFLHKQKNCKLPAFVGGLHRQFHVISFIQTFKRIPWELEGNPGNPLKLTKNYWRISASHGGHVSLFFHFFLIIRIKQLWIIQSWWACFPSIVWGGY